MNWNWKEVWKEVMFVSKVKGAADTSHPAFTLLLHARIGREPEPAIAESGIA